jgi:hypothetical protein
LSERRSFPFIHANTIGNAQNKYQKITLEKRCFIQRANTLEGTTGGTSIPF